MQARLRQTPLLVGLVGADAASCELEPHCCEGLLLRAQLTDLVPAMPVRTSPECCWLLLIDSARRGVRLFVPDIIPFPSAFLTRLRACKWRCGDDAAPRQAAWRHS